jgi:hypothetical protein
MSILSFSMSGHSGNQAETPPSKNIGPKAIKEAWAEYREQSDAEARRRQAESDWREKLAVPVGAAKRELEAATKAITPNREWGGHDVFPTADDVHRYVAARKKVAELEPLAEALNILGRPGCRHVDMDAVRKAIYEHACALIPDRRLIRNATHLAMEFGLDAFSWPLAGENELAQRYIKLLERL